MLNEKEFWNQQSKQEYCINCQKDVKVVVECGLWKICAICRKDI